jgi:hypothetical protein
MVKPNKPSRGTELVAAIKAEMAELNCVPTSTEEELLRMAGDTADRIERLEAIIAKEGETIVSPTGVLKTHPSVPEVRQQRSSLARILSSIFIGDSTGAAPKKNPAKVRAGLRSRDLRLEREGRR